MERGKGARCHRGEEIGPVDGIESVRLVVREYHGVGWVGAEGGVDGVTYVFGLSWDAYPKQLQSTRARTANRMNCNDGKQAQGT
jgi:hypothetical protein